MTDTPPEDDKEAAGQGVILRAANGDVIRYDRTGLVMRLSDRVIDFAPGWQQRLGISYGDILWPATGERLTAETFGQYRRQGGWVITFTMREENIARAIAHPGVMIASDGILEDGKGHPRAAGTYARVLGRYVREQKALSLLDAISRMTLLPAQRLESAAPMMHNKGRIKIGADADVTVFDPALVSDKATFELPAQYSVGMRYVLVNGVLVVKDGKFVEGVKPGVAIRR